MTTFKEPANILLVDDDSRNLDVLDSILACPDYRLFRARTADEALLALIAEEFAVIVLDLSSQSERLRTRWQAFRPAPAARGVGR